MKTIKRIITLLLAVLMICALTVPAFAQRRKQIDYDEISYGSSTLSQGSILIIVIIAVIAVLAVIYFVVRSKKKKEVLDMNEKENKAVELKNP